MTVQEYAKKHNIPVGKVKQMLSKLEGVRICECCGKYSIPENAIPIYIPNKNKYKRDAKKYCCVMDAVADGMRFDDNLSMITQEEARVCLNMLREANFIVLRNSDEDASTPLNYMLSAEGINWKQTQTEDKNQMIKEVLKTIRSIADAAKAWGDAIKPTNA